MASSRDLPLHPCRDAGQMRRARATSGGSAATSPPARRRLAQIAPLFTDYYERVRDILETMQGVLSLDGPRPDVSVAADAAALQVRKIVSRMVADDRHNSGGTEMTDVKGFFYPRTAQGGSSIIPDPPWFYSGDLLTVEYRTNPERVAELLPAPLELAPEDPGAVALIWADWQSCSSSREELLDPVRSQYKEAFVVVRCSFEGRTFSRCVYIWVDKDFAIARGMHQGYPKKLGTMWQTRPHPFAQGAPQIAAGWHVRCHAGCRRPPARGGSR